jgi:hypothetical protein
MTRRHVPESRDTSLSGSADWPGRAGRRRRAGRMSTRVEVTEAIPSQPRGARLSARTFSPHMTRPVSVKP